MPSLTFDEIKKFSEYLPDIFVETGTYMGDTVNNVLSNFDRIYSIELSQEYANLSSKRFEHIPKVKIIEGDSVQVLNGLCKNINNSVFFWLDGHWSSGNTARGPLDCPLLEELKIINSNLKSQCIIAIDDVRLFNTNINENWLNITRDNILKIVEARLESCKYYPSQLYSEDRMILHLRAI